MACGHWRGACAANIERAAWTGWFTGNDKAFQGSAHHERARHEGNHHLPLLAEAGATDGVPPPPARAGGVRGRAPAGRRGRVLRRQPPADPLRDRHRRRGDLGHALLPAAARLRDRRPLPGARRAGADGRDRGHAARRGGGPPRRQRLSRRGRGAHGAGLRRPAGHAPEAGLRLHEGAPGHRDGRHRAARDPRPRALQLPRRPDARSGPRLARLPLQLRPLLRRVPRRPQVPAAPGREGHRRDGVDPEQPALHRRQLARPGQGLAARAVHRDDPAEEDLGLPPDPRRRRDPGPRREGRVLVRLPGDLRHLGQDPRPHPAAQGPRHRRRGDDPARHRRPGRGRAAGAWSSSCSRSGWRSPSSRS